MAESSNKTRSRVLITGGSGLVGRYLTSSLLSEGYGVAHLSRKQDQFGKVRVYRWDPGKGIIDPDVFNGVDYLIHLAGANIGEGRWSAERREEIVRSRVDSSRLLHKTVVKNKIRLKAFISASAVGYYGSVTSGKIFTESDPPASDFLASTCRQWEESADAFEKSGIRTVKIRTAMVLEKNDSALRRLMMPARHGIVFRLGSGHQYMPWIHISDLCGIYLKAIEDQSFSGPYNAVSPQNVTHDEFMKTLGTIMNKPVFLPHIPSFVLSALLGERSEVVLKGSRISSDKISGNGFLFAFDNLNDALEDLLKE
jgi:uncharacterized protein (TIGR01777 family)